MTIPQINWKIKAFSELSGDQLYDIIKLRIDIFVVEQTCYYPELDNKDRDPDVLHLCGFIENELVAYARILPPNLSFRECSSIGRVAIAEKVRGQGLAHPLIKKSIVLCHQHWPGYAIKIGAQSHLTALYQTHGFVNNSEEYLEDGIPHIDMILSQI